MADSERIIVEHLLGVKMRLDEARERERIAANLAAACAERIAEDGAATSLLCWEAEAQNAHDEAERWEMVEASLRVALDNARGEGTGFVN